MLPLLFESRCLCIRLGVCIWKPEWHFIFHCPQFRDLGTSRFRDIKIGSEFIESARPSVALINLLSLCAKETSRIHPLGSFVPFPFTSLSFHRHLAFLPKNGIVVSTPFEGNSSSCIQTFFFCEGRACDNILTNRCFNGVCIHLIERSFFFYVSSLKQKII